MAAWGDAARQPFTLSVFVRGLERRRERQRLKLAYRRLHTINRGAELLVRHYGELIAYGAGWTDPERQQSVGDTGRHEPRHIDAILDAEIDRALTDPDPLRGVAQLTARWAAAFVLDPDAVTRTKALGADRMASKLSDALPGGDSPLRTAVWEFLWPMLSPALVALNRDAFITDHGRETTVDLDKHRSASSLDDLELDNPDAGESA